jgi:hypothetical protein
MLKTLWIAPVVVILGLGGLSGPLAADEEGTSLQAKLDGFGQVPPVITTGQGTFRGHINADGTISYKFTYSKLSATGVVSWADIHFGQEQFTPNGIIYFFCANSFPTGFILPPGTPVPPPCPSTSATFTDTIRANNIVGPAVQGIAIHDLSAALQAFLHDATYAQVHTAAFTGGEIRG